MNERQGQENGALRWKITRTCAATFALLAVVSLIVAGVEEVVTKTQNATVAIHESTEEGTKQSENWRNYIADRQQAASQLLRRPVSTDEILGWHQPYSDPNGNTVAKEVYQKLNPLTPESSTIDIHPSFVDSRPTLTPTELQARISENTSKLKETQDTIDYARRNGGFSEQGLSDVYRQWNATNQQLDIDKAYLKFGNEKS